MGNKRETDRGSIDIGDSIDISQLEKPPSSQQRYWAMIRILVDNNDVENLMRDPTDNMEIVVPRQRWQLIIPVIKVYEMGNAKLRIISRNDTETEVEISSLNAKKKWVWLWWGKSYGGGYET